MKVHEILKITIGFFLIAFGLLVNIISIISVLSFEKIIINTNLSILHGGGILSLLTPFIGVTKGGIITFFDTKLLYLAVIFAWTSIWIGFQLIVFTKRGIALKYVLSKTFWTAFDFEIFHKRKYREGDMRWVRRSSKLKK